MNLGGQGAKSMSMSSSSVSWKSGDGVSDQFPEGLRVLVVDNDPTCLMILEKMLRNCLYEVTKCNRAEIALSLLRENKNGFDIVISEVHMPDMDGFKLLEHIRLKMNLPVIMMSTDASERVVMKGVTHGADDYLIKPVRFDSLKNIWQHVVRKRKYERKDFEQSGSMEEGEQQQKPSEDADLSSSANEGNWRNSKRRKDEEDEMRLCIDGLLRRGKSCIHAWMNDIRLDIKRGNFSKEEEETTIKLYEMLGNRWSAIAAFLPGRTDNEIEYVWNTHLKKRLKHDQTMSIAKGESVTVSQGDSNASSESVAMNLSFSTQTGSESRVSPQDSSSDFSSCWNYL